MKEKKSKVKIILNIAIFAVLFILIGLTVLFFMKRQKKEGDGILLSVTEKEIEVEGLTREYRIYFLADSHISLCDERDAALLDKAKSRADSFMYDGIENEYYFKNLILDAADREADMVILGGDIVDSAMYKSIEYVEEQLNVLRSKEIPFLYYSGNHDFEYGSEYFSQTAYDEYLPRLDDIHGVKSYRIAEYEDLIIFTADDANNQITEEALEAFKKVIKKGKPVVLGIHVPLEPETKDTSFLEICKTTWGADDAGHSRVTIGPNGCHMNETTKEFRELVLAKDSPVVLVLGGHVHFFHEDELNERTIQIVTGAAFEGNAVDITLKPVSK